MGTLCEWNWSRWLWKGWNIQELCRHQHLLKHRIWTAATLCREQKSFLALLQRLESRPTKQCFPIDYSVSFSAQIQKHSRDQRYFWKLYSSRYRNKIGFARFVIAWVCGRWSRAWTSFRKFRIYVLLNKSWLFNKIKQFQSSNERFLD